MGTQVTLVYKVDAVGIAPAKIQPFVAAAEIPPEILAALGLRVSSDVTATAGNLITRTIVLQFDPSQAALATTVISNTSHIDSIVVNPLVDGLDYILPPIVRADDNAREPLSQVVQGNVINKRPTQRDAILKAWLDVKSAAIAVNGTGGAGYSPTPIVTFLGGLPPAGAVFATRRGFRGGCVRYINIADSGEGYNPLTAVLHIEGGSIDGNTPVIPAQGILTLRNGRVQSIAIVDMGQGYEKTPDVFITAKDGIGPTRPAKLFAVMAEGTPARATAVVNPLAPNDITALTITQRGDNYVGVPDILIRDATGTGATFRAQMSVSRIDVIDGGVGYFPGTTVTITDVFQDMFPPVTGDPQAQNKAFFQLFQAAIGQLAITPLRSDAPLVA